MYSGAVDETSDSHHPPPPDLQGQAQEVKQAKEDNFKEIQLRFLTFEEKNKRRIDADMKQKNAKKNKNILKWISCLKCCEEMSLVDVYCVVNVR